MSEPHTHNANGSEPYSGNVIVSEPHTNNVNVSEPHSGNVIVSELLNLPANSQFWGS